MSYDLAYFGGPDDFSYMGDDYGAGGGGGGFSGCLSSCASMPLLLDFFVVSEARSV